MMKTCNSYILFALFSLLSASQAWAQDIVGAWTRGDTTKEGSSVIVFFADGYFVEIEHARAVDAPVSISGVEQGKYTWNPVTGALTITIVLDRNGNAGVGRLSSRSGVTLNLSGDTATLSAPGFGTETLARVTGANPIVGDWHAGYIDDAGQYQTSEVVVFLPNGVYFEAIFYEDGTDGGARIEHGTYSWNPTTLLFDSDQTCAPCLDTNSYAGLSGYGRRTTANVFKSSLDGLYLVFGSGDWGADAYFARVGSAPNYQGMWVVPNLAEAGWGINLAHQNDLILASWFTYDASGKPWWLTMVAQWESDNSYTGAIEVVTGPPFSSVPFDPKRVTHKLVGTGRLSFSGANTATFSYTVNGISQTKSLTRFEFAAPMPVCTFQSKLHPNLAVNYQDIWIVPGFTEIGWGINFTHQGDLIFATWFIYDASGDPLWVSATLAKTTGTRTYTGTIDATTGPPFNSAPFDPARVTHSTVGTATVTFTDGANATLVYTLNGVSQTKALTRFAFRAPGTVCN